MGLLVLFGTGLLGVVLSLGIYFADGSVPALERILTQGTRLAMFAVPLVLVLVYLDATCDLAALSADFFSTITDNVGSFACRYGSSFTWD